MPKSVMFWFVLSNLTQNGSAPGSGYSVPVPTSCSTQLNGLVPSHGANGGDWAEAGAAAARPTSMLMAVARANIGVGRYSGCPTRTPIANRETIERFYTAFDAHDGDTMAACYAPGATFRDPAFGELSGERAGRDVADAHRPRRGPEGRASRARGGRDGRQRPLDRHLHLQHRPHVVNDIHAEFRFADDGRFAEHIDRFSYWNWSRQALGPLGLVLGWTPLLPMMTRRKALEQLESFERSET